MYIFSQRFFFSVAEHCSHSVSVLYAVEEAHHNRLLASTVSVFYYIFLYGQVYAVQYSSLYKNLERRTLYAAN